jgi:hypothetical protein
MAILEKYLGGSSEDDGSEASEFNVLEGSEWELRDKPDPYEPTDYDLPYKNDAWKESRGPKEKSWEDGFHEEQEARVDRMKELFADRVLDIEVDFFVECLEQEILENDDELSIPERTIRVTERLDELLAGNHEELIGTIQLNAELAGIHDISMEGE